MDGIREQALLTDLGRLKGAHNNLVKKFGGDVDMLVKAVQQLVAKVTELEGEVGRLKVQLQPRPQPVQPAQPQVTQVTLPPPAAPATPDVSWGTHDEEDADLVE